MIKLVFSKDYSIKEKLILSVTMKSNVIELGLNDKDFVIMMDKNDFRSSSRHAYHFNEKNTLGVMMPIAPKVFYLAMNINNDTQDTIFASGHEMVHVEQYLNHKIYDADDTGTHWKGEFFPAEYCNDPDNYLSLPWEVEAHRKDQELYDKAIDVLVPVLKKASEALQDATSV